MKPIFDEISTGQIEARLSGTFGPKNRPAGIKTGILVYVNFYNAENIDQIQHSLKEIWRTNLQRRHQHESVGESGKPRRAQLATFRRPIGREKGIEKGAH